MSLPLFIRAQVLLDEAPKFMTSLDLKTSLKALSPNAVTLGVRASTSEFGRWTQFRPGQCF